MSSSRSASFTKFNFARPAGVALLLGAVVLASPVAPAWAQTTPTQGAAASSGSAMSARTNRAAMREESVDQRIATLHSELKITPAEESDWQAVAQTMRDNAATMEKLASSKASDMQQGMTAVDDLQTYSQFAQAHVDGLKNLISSFQTLYNKMPDQQKKIADQVFANSRHQQSSARG